MSTFNSTRMIELAQDIVPSENEPVPVDPTFHIKLLEGDEGRLACETAVANIDAQSTIDGLGGCTPKLAFKTDADKRFLIKPYWRKHDPMDGWTEMTVEALYRAGGISHLSQKAHVSLYNGKPFLFIHMVNNGETMGDAYDKLDATNVHPVMRDFAKIAMMDYLTANSDRHSGNVLVLFNEKDNKTPVGGMSIDVGYALEYKGDSNYDNGYPSSVYGSFERSGLAYGSVTQPWRVAYVEEAVNWWKENGPFIREELDKHLPSVTSEKYRVNIRKWFNNRADTLDRFVILFEENGKNLSLFEPRGALNKVTSRDYEPVPVAIAA